MLPTVRQSDHAGKRQSARPPWRNMWSWFMPWVVRLPNFGRPRVSRRRGDYGILRVSTVGTAVTTCGMFAVFVTSAMAPQLRADLGMTATGLGFAVAGFFGASAVVSPFGGRLADRVGSLQTMRSGLIFAAACLLSIAFLVHGSVGLVSTVVAQEW